MLDIAIVGAGPAGLSAAINAVTLNKKVIVFGNDPKTSWLYKAKEVNNHLGMFGMSGKDMINAFVNHAKKMNVNIKNGKVIQIMPMGQHFTLNVDNDFFEAKTVIIATGIPRVKMLKNEEEYIGRGVSYCATCDGMLYKGRTVIVYGEDKKAEEEVEFLKGICAKIYFIPKYKTEITTKDNIEVLNGNPNEILGNDVVTGLKLGEKIINGDAVFLLRETTPVKNLLEGLEFDNKIIKVNREMETNIKGVYAVGDCAGTPYQLSKAIGEGLVATQRAVTYIFNEEKK
ncbi:MAG: NAD(P)/FAD-dependent oxidoreductase [Halanaerobiales bacterium]